MQLGHKKKRKVSHALGLFAASLFTASGVHAQDMTASSVDNSDTSYFGDEAVNTLGSIHFDSDVLFYHESGGRVQAIEPAANMTWTSDQNDILTLGVVVDSLTGASPNGAAPLNQIQTFIAPSKATNVGGTTISTTGASGQIIPVTVGGVTTYTRQYTVAPNTLPLDIFMDTRAALNFSFSTLLNSTTHVSYGLSLSKEHDYFSATGNAGIAKDFNSKNTTVSLGVNYEADFSSPYYGTPIPLSPMNGNYGSGNRRKGGIGIVLGLTQVMNRHWLAQINYSYGYSKGYQTDPYRIISVIDGTAAVNPAVNYIYENRPEKRTRQSIYIGNKIAFGHAVTDISARFYHDSWGITSETVEASERVPLNSWIYIEPHVRWYSQSKTNFYVDYLLMGQALPDYASSDSRLGKFTATTFGLKMGFKMWDTGELYLRAETYQQHGDQHPAGVIPALAQQNLFSGVKAFSAIMGLSFDF